MDQLNDIPNTGIYTNPLFTHALNTILGCPVVLRTKNNCLYHGMLDSFSPDLDVILKCCHKIDATVETVIYDKSIPEKSNVKTFYFERDDIVEMNACEVDTHFAIKILENSFIDSAIVEKSRVSDEESLGEEFKELVPYVFDSEYDSSDLDSGLVSKEVSPLVTNNKTGWNAEDMLNINEIKFGYKSTYKSDLSDYTIPLEKRHTDEYKRRELEAEKIAHEIEKSKSYRRNIDKELSDNEEEEYAFSAVIRTDSNNNSLRRFSSSRKTPKNNKSKKNYKN
ncbi:unnamed protein product [Brachionus calyciflorus]|uniref:LsmAD domain-containing protein n=1 Tax=Brachionus calyciflorus TaxID=104777 RepID=A0A814N316_9BILA|nr:unnamed protein product [Brachionus calyciflorus]